MDIPHLIIIFIALAVLAAAAVAAVILCVIAFAMLMVSVLAISVLVGFSSGNALAGVRAFFVQLGVLSGAMMGAVTALTLTHVWPAISHHGVILVMGGATGAFGGLLVALLAYRAVQLAMERFPKLRLPRTTLIPSS
ncbi:hypothetical protein [Roseimicrobium sp. ORNL1]|uniref:hypothetical protein n=1 Tax=Roseimicrobium sp. ORNL1 TaxID=2711231 RepID=UPI0013E11639|nr:hypothetical protein [Roseimicrobium sp. ORNL1]QIF05611.1 hypothetical protein G5S37_30300 [Roseimicrobium sp. ORNL1]